MPGSSSPPRLPLEGLAASLGGEPVLYGIDLEVAPGEFLALMGPNGSGKTSLLRAIAGLAPIDRGTIRIDGRRVDGLPTHRRGIGLLAQEPALFPRRRVSENIAYGLELARGSDASIADRVRELVQLMRLEGLEDRRSEALSGGERQRVALARTLAPAPSVVLLDEPFASVDPERRNALRADFRRALAATGTAAIHVTHDREEGLFLGDRVALLLEGRIVQSGPPAEVYAAPAGPDAARFLGYNVLQGPSGEPLAVDPRAVELDGLDNGVEGVVEVAGITPDGFVAVLRGADGERLEVRGAVGARVPAPGQKVRARWKRAIRLEG